MNAFEIGTSCIAGAVLGFIVAAFAGWRNMGFLSLVSGAVGGLIGGSLGHSWFKDAPVWGSMNYHPFDLVFAAVGGLLAVLVVRIFWGGFRPPHEPTPGTR
jgi:hypothetical protein